MRRCCCSSTVALSTVAPPCAVVLPKRGYYWPHNEDFVPQGAATSRFQSSGSPELRRRVLREYAFSPLFGARVPCCVLGTMKTAKEFFMVKRGLPRLLCEIMGSPEGSVTLGPLQQMSEMMLHKSGTPLSPRLGDTRNCNINAYGRKSVAARTIVEVFLPEHMSQDQLTALGRLMLEEVQTALSVLRKGSAGSTEGKNSTNCALTLVRDMGISYCEIPLADESDYVFDRVGGVAVSAYEAEEVAERWVQRDE
uniref:Uncharacterized protein n=1 Tax=Trypanosoma congolense (strain IL3000) TaxID=1068625 RepID=G0V0J4_TRYCI|nr:conserved hypothetical protein [Trypanosoma congolense IL3000]